MPYRTSDAPDTACQFVKRAAALGTVGQLAALARKETAADVVAANAPSKAKRCDVSSRAVKRGESGAYPA